MAKGDAAKAKKVAAAAAAVVAAPAVASTKPAATKAAAPAKAAAAPALTPAAQLAHLADVRDAPRGKKGVMPVHARCVFGGAPVARTKQALSVLFAHPSPLLPPNAAR